MRFMPSGTLLGHTSETLQQTLKGACSGGHASHTRDRAARLKQLMNKRRQGAIPQGQAAIRGGEEEQVVLGGEEEQVAIRGEERQRRAKEDNQGRDEPTRKQLNSQESARK